MNISKWILAAVAAFGLTAPAKAYDWGGFYAGVLGGGTFVVVEGNLFEGALGVAKVAGYNWQDGNKIWGVEAMLGYAPLHFEDPGVYKVTLQKMFRIGTEVTDNVMVYGAAGLGYAVIHLPGEPPLQSGYGALAAGVEAALGENVVWRGHVQASHPFMSESPFGILWTVGGGFVWYAH
jgi:hypothetical protein